MIRFKRKLEDEISFLLCVLFLVIRPFLKFTPLHENDIWLISEKEDEARDNGYNFFLYLEKKKIIICFW